MTRYFSTGKIAVALIVGGVAAQGQQVAFQGALISNTDRGPAAMVAGDFNRDGKADIAIAEPGSKLIAVSLGKGDGSFQPAATYSAPAGCVIAFLATGDFNNDRNLDLLGACEFGSQVLVFLGRGDGRFAAPVMTSLPRPAFMGMVFIVGISQGIGPAIADFDRDGNLDLVLLLFSSSSSAAINNGSVFLMRGRGDGTFGQPAQIQVSGAPTAVVSGDFNRDGKTDLALLTVQAVSGSAVQMMAIELGNGDGSFHAGAAYSWSGATFGLQIADLNGDGLADIISTGPNFFKNLNQLPPSGVTVWLGNGDGTFTQKFSSVEPNDAWALGGCLADLHGTGEMDLVEALVTVESEDIAIGIRGGNSDGSFQNLQRLTGLSGVFPLAFLCSDLNGDGLTDVAYSAIPTSQFLSVAEKDLIEPATVQEFGTLLSDLPAGDLYVLLNSSPPELLTLTNVNAASFQTGPLAADSIATATGRGLARSIASAATSPPPTALNGVSVAVQDSSGVSRLAPLFYVSPTQINYAIPSGTAAGQATISVSGAHNLYRAQQQIATVGPGIFAANGLAVGSIVTGEANGQSVTSLVQADASGNIVPVPVDVGSGSSQVFLVLYGTGIRNHANPVTVTLGTTSTTASYAGPQGFFVGEDQINILVPQSLKGAGLISVTMNVDGQTTNPVKVLMK